MTNQPIKGEPLVILLAEDDPDHAHLLMRSLQDHRMANKVYRVADGEAAEDYLFRKGNYADPTKSPRPHVILLDVRLRKVDGLELIGQIKTSDRLREIPVVMLTTSKAEQDVLEAHEQHADGYLVKPVDFAQLARMMGKLGFCWLCWNQYPWSEQAP